LASNFRTVEGHLAVARLERSPLAIAFRYFAAVAENGSIRGAAAALSVAPSAINRQVLIIERGLGTELFERVGRSLRLSEAGHILLAHVRGAERTYEDARSAINELRGLKRGKVHLATVESVSVHMVPELLAAFLKLYPGIEVAVTVTGAETVTGLVRSGEADMGVTFNPHGLDGLEVAFQRSFPIGALMAPDHPLARRRRLALADCAEYPLVMPARGLSLRNLVDTALRTAARPVRPAVEANSLRLMAALARRGGCISFQTVIGIEPELAAGSLVLVPLADETLPLNHLTFLRQAGRKGSPAAKALAEHLVGGLAAWRPRLAGRSRAAATVAAK
jgi:DNA-binding transcriptional LysR family regulator